MNEEEDTPLQTINAQLLETLICPESGGRVDHDKTANEIISKKAGLAYPIKNGIPIMLASEARSLDT